MCIRDSVVGDPNLKVHTVAGNWGYAGTSRPFARPDLDVLVIGEAREWELIEYAADTITSGRKKGLIVLGHIPSEQAGMIYCCLLYTSLPIGRSARDRHRRVPAGRVRRPPHR